MFNTVTPAVVILMLSGAVALASPCGDQIRQLEPKMEAVGHSAVAANSGGQAVAAERGAASQKAEGGKPDPEASSMATQARDQAGGVGEKFQDAKVALNDARTADAKGDTAACDAAVSRAKALIKP